MSSVRVVVEDSLVELSSIKTGLPFSRFIDRIILQFRSYCSFASAAHDDGAPSPASQQTTCVVVVVVVGGDNQIIIYLCPPERFSQRAHGSCCPEGCARRERGQPRGRGSKGRYDDRHHHQTELTKEVLGAR